MKSLVTIIVIMLTCGVIAQGVATTTRPQSTTDLKTELAALQTRVAAAESKDATFTSKFAGIGAEMGAAFNGFVEALDGGLEVTTERVNEFAKTDVGKFAMVGIGWKIFADDIIGIFSNVTGKLMGILLLKNTYNVPVYIASWHQRFLYG